MKICPICKRSYADDLSFCLEDGAHLAAAYAPQKPAQEATAILPGGLRPLDDRVSAPRATAGASPLAYTYQPPQSPERRVGKLWLIVGSVIVIGIVTFTALAGWFVWQAINKSNAGSSQAAPNSPNQNPGENNVPATVSKADPNSESQTAESTNLEWLTGVWSGDAYQTDTKTRWAVRLTVRDGTYSIDYPDIPCGGTWKLIEKNSQSASFTEVITQGLERCGNNSHVMIEKLSTSELSCRYTRAGSREVIATVVLTKKE